MTNEKLLREKIKESGFLLQFIARKIGITPYSLNLKMTNKREFKASEIAAICVLLGIESLNDKEQIFFAQTVEK